MVGVRLLGLLCAVFILAKLKSAVFHESQQLTTDWEYKQHAAVVVSVRKNGEVEVCCVTNCDLHN